ncbi:exonuclease 3'-5' domain-containing protein 2-like [Penaeus chinensis]|uniref:exonuclease 3'-5' domain-containing protein 2-like n=1 Tax=Penaeus chinensis TaxID=139456 RepID=UPI001FB74BD5|nr:exonuclease 3'-5' domain-containing protein 2-like [Penaeus chinensis]
MSVMWLRDHPGLTMSLFLGVGVTGGLVYHSRSIAQAVKSARLMRSVKSASRKVYIVNSEESWSQVSSLLLREARLKGAIGFDCEWVQVRGKRRPVALLQLASCSGTCVLVRLLQMKTSIPQTLKTPSSVKLVTLDDVNSGSADFVTPPKELFKVNEKEKGNHSMI